MGSKLGRVACVAMMIAVAGACASGSTGETAETTTPAAGAAADPALRISILNEHASSGSFVLFIEQVGGIRRSLGNVQASTSPTFNFAATTGAAYVLVQQTDTGETRTSDRFTFPGPTTVTWDMNTRRLTVVRR